MCKECWIYFRVVECVYVLKEGVMFEEIFVIVIRVGVCLLFLFFLGFLVVFILFYWVFFLSFVFFGFFLVLI